MATENCHNCVYAYWDRCQTMQGFVTGFASRPACANHPESLGRMRPVPSGGPCRNYRPRPPEPEGDARRIPLGDGLYAYVDAADYDWLSRWTWSSVNGYAARNEKGKIVYMHRQILQAPPGKIVDHFNHNKLDDTRPNLRLCLRHENQRNQRKKRGSLSKYKGVGYSKDRHKWYAQIKIMGKDIWLGYYKDEIEAARAYDRKAVELFGEFANLNFPEEWPPDRRKEVYAGGEEERKKAGRKEDKKGTSTGRKRVQHPRRGESSFARTPAALQKAKGKKAKTRRKTNKLPQRTPRKRNR